MLDLCTNISRLKVTSQFKSGNGFGFRNDFCDVRFSGRVKDARGWQIYIQLKREQIYSSSPGVKQERF
jgi:hypothetical protein